MEQKEIIREDLVKAFNQMWGKFPETVLLIHKSRTIVAYNEQAENVSQGMLSCGMKCSSCPGDHSRCRANEALRERKTTTLEIELAGEQRLSFWVPVEDELDYYVHFNLPVKKKEEITV
jgi:inner membrane protein involved in colicin E2 resistance